MFEVEHLALEKIVISLLLLEFEVLGLQLSDEDILLVLLNFRLVLRFLALRILTGLRCDIATLRII
jgi:hypothetical protein